MKRLGLGIICAALLATAPCASAQDSNAALAQYNCGSPAAPPAVPNGAHATGPQLQAFSTRAAAWQTAQLALGQCVATADTALTTQNAARVAAYEQHRQAAAQATAAWQAAAAASSNSH